MIDPLSEVISLLRPRAVFSKGISGAGRWAVRYSRFDKPSFCTVLDGSCLLTLDGLDTVTLEAGDFVFLPTTPGFTMSGHLPAKAMKINPKTAPTPAGDIRHGTKGGPPDVRLLGGHFEFDAPDTDLLVALIPPLVHVRGVPRLATLVQMLREESRDRKSGREFVLTRLVEVMLVEALRAISGEEASVGLLRGLADPGVSTAIRQMHRDPSRDWTIEQLARKSELSRSTFFERFTQAVGMAPMEYLLAWRMTIAKDILRRESLGVAEVAKRVGYGSASTFSTAFSRYVGEPPGRFARRG